MSKSHPSPLPWKRGTDGLIFDANNELVTDTCGTSIPKGEENQRYIVRAVNCHADLLETCENATVSLSIAQLPRLDNSVATNADIIAVTIKLLQAAIQKAEPGDTEKP